MNCQLHIPTYVLCTYADSSKLVFGVDFLVASVFLQQFFTLPLYAHLSIFLVARLYLSNYLVYF
jgi:predicted membrane protein